MRRKLTIRSYAMLAGAFILGLVVALGTSNAFGQVACPASQCPAIMVADVPAVAMTRTIIRPRVVVPQAVVTTQPRVVFAQPMRPAFTVVQAPAPQYTIVETPRAPFVVNGLFRDRVVQPRRSNLSIIAQ